MRRNVRALSIPCFGILIRETERDKGRGLLRSGNRPLNSHFQVNLLISQKKIIKHVNLDSVGRMCTIQAEKLID